MIPSPLDELRGYSLGQIALAIVIFFVGSLVWINVVDYLDLNEPTRNCLLLMLGGAAYCWWKDK